MLFCKSERQWHNRKSCFRCYDANVKKTCVNQWVRKQRTLLLKNLKKHARAKIQYFELWLSFYCLRLQGFINRDFKAFLFSTYTMKVKPEKNHIQFCFYSLTMLTLGRCCCWGSPIYHHHSVEQDLSIFPLIRFTNKQI